LRTSFLTSGTGRKKDVKLKYEDPGVEFLTHEAHAHLTDTPNTVIMMMMMMMTMTTTTTMTMMMMMMMMMMMSEGAVVISELDFQHEGHWFNPGLCHMFLP